MNRDTHFMLSRLENMGISVSDALQLRRIAMTLNRWNELECGNGHEWGSYVIERDDETDIPYMVHHHYGHGKYPGSITRRRVPDREKGALKRLAKIMEQYPNLVAYHQGDPRGASLYIVPRSSIPNNAPLDSCYTNGIAVFE